MIHIILEKIKTYAQSHIHSQNNGRGEKKNLYSFYRKKMRHFWINISAVDFVFGVCICHLIEFWICFVRWKVFFFFVLYIVVCFICPDLHLFQVFCIFIYIAFTIFLVFWAIALWFFIFISVPIPFTPLRYGLLLCYVSAIINLSSNLKCKLKCVNG